MVNKNIYTTMKSIIFYITLICFALLQSCDNELKQEVVFDVIPYADNAIIDENTVIKVNTPITFSLHGNPDFITFYSGELGRLYDGKDKFEIPTDEIETSELNFENLAQYGRSIPGTLKVYLSTEFNGLLGNDKVKDSLAIENAEWIDITNQCNLAQVTQERKKTVLSLKDYLGKKLTIAFQYITSNSLDVQPTQEIIDLHISNLMKNKSVATINAISMGFSPIDLLSNTNPYIFTGNLPNWNTAFLTSVPPRMRVQSSVAGSNLNNDWLISSPIKINFREADVGMQIKNIANPLDSYQYTYSEPGEYTVTFVARNMNYKYSSNIVKKIIIKIEE